MTTLEHIVWSSAYISSKRDSFGHTVFGWGTYNSSIYIKRERDAASRTTNVSEHKGMAQLKPGSLIHRQTQTSDKLMSLFQLQLITQRMPMPNSKNIPHQPHDRCCQFLICLTVMTNMPVQQTDWKLRWTAVGCPKDGAGWRAEHQSCHLCWCGELML